MNPSPDSPPRLQRPGAGLPWWELLAAKFIIFPRAVRRLGWRGGSSLFQREGSKILALWDAAPDGSRSKRILIARLRGIEDSSRYWSVAMTVEHLTIVGERIRTAIGNLRAGNVPTERARIEDVKPTGTLPPDTVRADFERLLALQKADDASQPPIPRREGPKAPHPWFGPLDAHQWHCLLGLHQRIHRVQIEQILKGMAVG